MAHIYCYDVYPNKRTNLDKMADVMKRHGFTEKSNNYGTYYHIETSGWNSWDVIRVIKRYNYRYKKYEKRWERNSKYRNDFFTHNRGPYRCAYCGKRLKTQDIEVDHLIPVAQTKKSSWARFLLAINYIYNVNDYRNLVAACHHCNQRKSDNMGWWVIKGTLGKHKLTWLLRDIIRIIILMFIIYEVYLNWDLIVKPHTTKVACFHTVQVLWHRP